MSFYLRKEWIDLDENVKNVHIYYTVTNLNENPIWENAQKREMFIEPGGEPKVRSKVIKLPRNLNGEENYLLYYYFEIFTTNDIVQQSKVFVEEVISDDSFTYIDYDGNFTNICLYWSINGWHAPNYSAMFIDGIALDNPFSSLHFYKRSNDYEYLWGRSQLLKSIPLPHIFRGRVHGPKNSRSDYCYHIVSKTVDHDYGFWDNNNGWNFYKPKIGKDMWQNLFGKNTYPHTIVGDIKTLPQFYCPQLGVSKQIYIYLPPSYNSSNKHYPVIYMQDGQNLFDNAISFAGEWMVDETMEALSLEGYEAIVVGIENGKDKRILEYNPFARNNNINGDQYLHFIIDTLKPKIDKDFKTLTDKKHTGIIGSSLGALISLYGFFMYPETFGFVGALSHWMWIKGNVMPKDVFQYINKAGFNDGRIYLDIGKHENVGQDITGMSFDSRQAVTDTRTLFNAIKKKKI